MVKIQLQGSRQGQSNNSGARDTSVTVSEAHKLWEGQTANTYNGGSLFRHFRNLNGLIRNRYSLPNPLTDKFWGNSGRDLEKTLRALEKEQRGSRVWSQDHTQHSQDLSTGPPDLFLGLHCLVHETGGSYHLLTLNISVTKCTWLQDHLVSAESIWY